MTHKSELLGYQGATGDFFENLQERYGARLEALNVDDKLMLLSTIFFSHTINCPADLTLKTLEPVQDTPAHVAEILKGLDQYDSDRHLAFCLALTEQVREFYRAFNKLKPRLCKAGLSDEFASQVAEILLGGGDRTEWQCEIVDQAWQEVVKVDKKLAAEVNPAMGLAVA